MHWILTTPDAFSLTQVIRRSQWLLQPPFAMSRSKDALNRVERLASGKTVALTVAEAPAGLIIRTHEHLNGKDAEEVCHKIWRILRLGENLQPFLDLVRHIQGLESVPKHGARILRGATPFEDAVKAVIFASEDHTVYEPRITWLVDRFGDSLPSNPTHHAFPTPRQLLGGTSVLHETLGPAMAGKLIKIATVFAIGEEQFDALITERLSAADLVVKLTQLLEMDAAELALFMLSLGRYNYIPADSVLQQRLEQSPKNRTISPADVRAALETLQPWGGLAFWLWDWSVAFPVLPKLRGK